MWMDDCNIRSWPVREASENGRTMIRAIVIAILVVLVGTATAWVGSAY